MRTAAGVRLVGHGASSGPSPSATYAYGVDRIPPRTTARHVGVVRPVPRSLVRPGYGCDEPGHHLTPTTRTLAKLVSARPG
ncbi:hypothetical protein ACF1DV_12110 [Streptomyces achromogenes]|uniref:hypothetical protein n=1 Tax=Streptomyces achromogenes TaxID=67255 RepID=UPI0036FF6AB3